ncbi:MAG: hypothetical protein C0594_15475 [Marinilabiliales bacterium]|nr:MAG: hypothetical protein C0594_15475 [Marinilabiliales bacterium]
MTGATSGLGKISAMKLANNGDTIIVLARNTVKGEALKSEFHNQYPNALGKIEIIEGNLNCFDSVHSSCLKIKSKYPVIDMIVNNAGIMNFEFKQTVDKIEETLQVNLLSPLLICHILFNNLIKANDPKIIFSSSGLHQGEIDFKNIEFENSFSSFKVYRQSKLGVILICRLLANSLKEYNVGIYSQHPGVVRTNLGRNAGWFSKMIFYVMGKSPEKGSQTLTYLMETPNLLLETGEYYADCKVTETSKESYNMEVAQKLLIKIQEYLKKYITLETPVFPKEE